MIDVQGLNFAYGKTTLFQGLNLELKPGNIYGLLGKNGAGKTTLLRLVSGLLFADGGSISFFGRDPSKRKHSILSDIFFLAEDFHVPPISGNDYLCLYADFYPRFDREHFHSCLQEFSIPSDKKLTKLSFGQRKKFLLSFGLACGCRLLLLDEPTNGLDIPSKSIFRKLVASSWGEERIIVISTHQVRDMENLIDPIVIVDSGSIILNQSLDRIAEKVKMRFVRELPREETPLYTGQSMGGYLIVEENRGGEESSLDIEVLFNAVMAESGETARLLSGGVA